MMPTGQKPTKSAAQLYADRETRSKSSMRAEFGRLTTIDRGVITRIPNFTDKVGQVWTLHDPNDGGLVYYYKEQIT